MPRRPRCDAPGAIHHVYVRAIERRDLFLDELDRWVYVDRLSRVLPEAGATCLAWAMPSNHGHLVVRTGHVPLAQVMQRVGTAYGRHFNDRYGREGYVFQGRYGAQLVEDDTYLRVLIRYVHRNPIEAGLVASLDALEEYPWAGHAALMNRLARPSFQSIPSVLELFGPSPALARASLRDWMSEAPGPLGPPVGDPEALDGLIASVCRELGMDEREVRSGRRTRSLAIARDEITRRAVTELGARPANVARALGVSRQALWRRLDSTRTRSDHEPQGN